MADKPSATSSRKADHIRINLNQDVQSGLSAGFEGFHFPHQALPELDLEQVRTDFELFGKKISLPLFISSMTGGTDQAREINQNLAAAAQETGIPLGVGSQRAALEDPGLAQTFQVRKSAPDILLFANLGAVQLNYGLGPDDCQRAVDMIEADALFLHLNPLQEAVMEDGNTRFSGLLGKIESVCRTLAFPVVIKEVGWGLTGELARQLANAGASALDVAGAGGTSWTEVEMHRAKTDQLRAVAGSFLNWGIPTAESLIEVSQAVPDLPVFASGGIKNGVDIAKAAALGATMTGLAGQFLKAAASSPRDVVQVIRRLEREIQISMFAAGAGDLEALGQIQLQRRSPS